MAWLLRESVDLRLEFAAKGGGHVVIFEDGVHAIPLVAIGLRSDGELCVVFVARVVFVEGGFEESLQIFVARDSPDGCVDGVDVAVDAFFGPEHPNFFVEFVVEEFPVGVAQEVVRDEDFWRFVEFVL